MSSEGDGRTSGSFTRERFVQIAVSDLCGVDLARLVSS